jgi:hypothetical protein
MLCYHAGMKTVKQFLPVISANINRKGVLDVDTVKGCERGMASYERGCYGLCYAAKMATLYGFDFARAVSRRIVEPEQVELFPGVYGPRAVARIVKNHRAAHFRIGTMGDPSHDWELTADVVAWLRRWKVPEA